MKLLSFSILLLSELGQEGTPLPAQRPSPHLISACLAAVGILESFNISAFRLSRCAFFSGGGLLRVGFFSARARSASRWGGGLTGLACVREKVDEKVDEPLRCTRRTRAVAHAA